MEIDDSAMEDDEQVLVQPKKKKCHGNRKDQRFRKKWRARGMKGSKIERLIKRRNKNNPSNTTRTTTKDQKQTTTTTTTVSTVRKNDLKRKHDRSLQTALTSHATTSKSISSISSREPVTKKMKKTRKDPITTSTIVENIDLMNIHYRQPMYLKRSSFMLFKMLHKRFKQPIKDKSERQFIYLRLNLLDQHYFLEAHQYLWESYMKIGLELYQWPEELWKMAKTDDFKVCEQYLINFIEDIKKQMDYLKGKLSAQTDSYPITSMSLEQIDSNLNDFINCERKYLFRRNNHYLEKFKENIQKAQSLKDVNAHYPTIDQKEYIAQLVHIREKQTAIWEEQLMLETRILCQFLPLEFDYLQHFIIPIDYIPLNNEQRICQINNQRHKLVKETKHKWLNNSLSIYEVKLQDYDQQYQELLIQLKSLLINNTSLQGDLLFNQINEYMNNQTKELKQKTIKKISAFQGKLVRHRQCSSSTKTMIGVSPEPYLDLISNPFDKRELHHLSLGPACIRINQSAIRSEKHQEIEIKHIHDDIFIKVQNHLVEYYHIPRTLSIFETYSNQMRDYLHRVYSTPLSYKDHLQAKEQTQIVASIRRKLRQNQLIIRMTDKSNNFYIGQINEYEKKVQKYFTDTNAYIQLTETPFDDVLDKVIQLLNQLRAKKFILKWQYDRMFPGPKKTELAHLYFNPKTHKNGIPVRPIINSMRAPTTKISKFLDKIIRPIFDDKCRQTTIIDGASLIQDLRSYQRKGLLKPSTLFCTFDIHNLYTMLPQEESLNILIEFLHLHNYRKVKGVPLDTIRKLASIVIKDNVFIYEKKFYRQVIGGAMGSSFTLTLANIFMWKWQKELVRQQDMTGEYFGRYIDDVFMTWNKSEAELEKLLNQANQWHPNIKLDYKINRSLPFLDVLLANQNGLLFTSVYHKPTAEPYVVPYISDHHPHVFRNIIGVVLRRAIRYSSNFEIFQRERRYIKLMLLYNGYPSGFVDDQFQRFFTSHLGVSSFLPYIYHEQQFIPMHHKIKDQLTPRQSQVSQSAATADIDNDQTDDNPRVSESTTEKKTTSYGNKLFIHYTHEKRFRSVKRDMHHVYENVFKNTPAIQVKLVVGNRNRRDARHELIHKKPKLSLLQNKARQIKTKYKNFLARHRKRIDQGSNQQITTAQQ